MKYECICGYRTNNWDDWMYHMFGPKTPYMSMRDHRRITTTLISGI
jgi:hypothetical protein